jgi:hypothetical protein
MLVTFAAALVIFAVVQDRVTASGARQYVALRHAESAGGSGSVTIDEVMSPAVERSVRQGLAWSGGVVAAGLLASRIGAQRP